MNNTSDFRYDYLALTNAIYKKSFDFVIDRKSGKITEEKFLKQNEYIIFRTRTETNNLGHVIRANYGRIGEDLDHMFGLRIRAWFNPNENDTNLEDARLVP